MNRPHAERKPFLVPINDETKHEGETRLAKAEFPPQPPLKISSDNCHPIVPCHQGLFPELTPKPVEELPPPPKIDKYKLARFLTDKAIREKRIFTICGPYPVIRTALRKRGWVERKYTTKGDPQDPKNDGNETENDNIAKTESKSGLREDENHSNNTSDIHELMSRLVRNEETSFYWTIKKDAVDYYNLHVDQMLNHYARTGSFTTKIGLCLNMRNLPWYVSANQNTFFPRCYGICMDDEKCDFIDDFRKTAATGIVKWVVNVHVSGDKNKRSCAENRDTEGSTQAKHIQHFRKRAPKRSKRRRLYQKKVKKSQNEPDGKKTKELSGQIVEMACKVCETYLHQIEHEDIDTDLDSAPVLSEKEWNQLLEQYYCLIHEDGRIRNADNYFAQCQNILHKILLADPQQKIDGLHNIWIIKPGAKSRGREIVCKNRLEDILKLVEPTDQIPIKDHKWVVQKYIETPLLIYDTKFDIRQWFLVTDWNPLTLWFYKESYLRFSTQRFSLDNLHSSIHLCNNSIQKNYKNAPDRSSQLPHHNMWSSTKFQEYLQKKGFGHVWCNVIYPSMKKILIYTMKMAQDQVESRKSSFELYGADFILGNDFKPWLIEINSSPTMYPSTPITSDLCAQVQEDTIRIVIDRKIDRNSNIGKFELLWKQPILDLPPFNPAELFVEGINVKKLRNQPVPLSNFNFLEPLVSVVCPEINEENKRNASGSVNNKQSIKVKQGTSIPCTLPKTLKKLQEKTLKVKTAQKKPNKFIDFPRIIYDHEETSMADKKKTKATKEPSHQTGTQAATNFSKSNALDWALLQPSKETGLQDKNKKTPCLICGDSFQPTKACKHCSSFCATVLQGGSYLPMGSCSPPEKMGKNRLTVPCYGLPKYF